MSVKTGAVFVLATLMAALPDPCVLRASGGTRDDPYPVGVLLSSDQASDTEIVAALAAQGVTGTIVADPEGT